MTRIITTHRIEDETGAETEIRLTWTPETITKAAVESAEDVEIRDG